MTSISNDRETGSQTVAVTKVDYGASDQSDIPPILVHGSWVSHSNCDQVAPQLVEMSRVVTYDRRGHSDGGRSATSDSVHDDVTDLAGLIEHLGIAPACVDGNSFGASVALRVDASRPALVRGVIAHEPPLFGRDRCSRPGEWARCAPTQGLECARRWRRT